MKRYFVLAIASILAFASCAKESTNDLNSQDVVDSIELTPVAGTVDGNGGSTSTMVSSSSDWTLSSSEKYDWVTPSAVEGKDSDIVKFEVSANEGEQKQAVFTFVCGTAKADFTVTSLKKAAAPTLSIDSESEASVDHNAGEFIIKANCSLGYRAVKVALTDVDPAEEDKEESKRWIKLGVNTQGETENDALIHVIYNQQDGLMDRHAVINISVDGIDQKFSVNFTQKAKLVLSVESTNYAFPIDGGDIKIPVISNVDYDVESSASWVTVKSKSNTELVLSAGKTTEKRTATVTLVQKNVAEGTPLKAVINIVQQNTLISWAADMKNSRLYPVWPVNNMREADFDYSTVEAMIYIRNFDRQISTVFGVEGVFLLRFGDANLEPNIMQVAFPNGNNFPIDYEFKTNTWYHIAYVFKSNQYQRLYVNGAEVANLDGKCDLFGLPLARSFYKDERYYNASQNKYTEWRVFWFGYSWEYTRFFDGLMTELRFWHKGLSPQEINAKDHFYTVPENSKGLMNYWKFTEGTGNKVSDKSKVNFVNIPHVDLEGEVNVGKNGGTLGINWVPVALPEK